MFSGLLDPDPLVRGMDPDPNPSSSSKNSRKIFDSSCFVTFFCFLSLNNYVNVPSKSNKQKHFFKLICFCWRLEDQWRKKQDPDPLVRGMDPRIRIRNYTKSHGSRTLLSNNKKNLRIQLHTENSRGTETFTLFETVWSGCPDNLKKCLTTVLFALNVLRHYYAPCGK